MDRDEALRLLNGGREGIRDWNDHREGGGEVPSLAGANLTRTDLAGADLTDAYLAGANLAGADLIGAYLAGADLTEANLAWAFLSEAYLVKANLTRADLARADLARADLTRADLTGAKLVGAKLVGAKLTRAKLVGADLARAKLVGADLADADLADADLADADLADADLADADLAGARCGFTAFGNLDLSQIRGLDQVIHDRPSTVGVDTISQSKGQIPAAFLGGCGLPPWMVLSAKLHDTTMTPPQFVEIQYEIFDAWTKGINMINGCFISYSWKDSNFVEKLRDRLIAEGVNVWLDKHDMIAGNIQDQVWRAIQLHHVVVLVLSKDSVKSDWVENELDMARRKEKAEGRAVLCPVALDDAWRAKLDATAGPGDANRALWRTLETKLVMDFSPWKTKAFDGTFGKLVRGLKVNYGPKDSPAS